MANLIMDNHFTMIPARTAARALLGAALVFRLLVCASPAQERPDGPPQMAVSAPRQVFVPNSELEAVLKRDREGVVLPAAEFRTLLDAVRERERTQPRLPAEAVVTSADYAVSLLGERARITARVRFRQFVDQWTLIELPLRGLALESAKLGDAPARIARRQGDQDTLQLFHDRAGDWLLELEFTAPIASVGSDRVAAFGLLQTPAAAMQVVIPVGKELLVNGLSVADGGSGSPEGDADGTRQVRLPVGDRPEVTLRLTAARTGHTTDSLVFASSAFGLVVQPGEVSWQTRTQLQVFGTPIDRLVFSVPASLEIADVTSNGLESWALSEDPQDATRTQIVLDYRQPFQDGREVTFRGVMSVETDDAWTVPNLLLRNVTSHVGRLVVHYPQGTRLVPEDSAGVRRAEEGRTSGYVGSSPELSESIQVFEVWQEDFELAFVTQTKQREVQANLSTIVSVTESGLDLGTVITLQCLYAPVFQVEVTLPAEWTVLETTVASEPVDWLMVPRAAGEHQLSIVLPEPLLPGQRVQIELKAHRDLEDWPNRAETAEFRLPEVAVPQSSVVDGTYLIKAADDLDVVPLTLEGLDPAFLNIPGERAGFRYQDSTFSATFRVSRQTTRMAAHSTSYTRLDPDALRTHLEITLDVNAGGARVVAISLPENISRDLRFEILPVTDGQPVPTLVEQVPSQPADGRQVWTLTLDRRLRHQAVLAVDLETPRSEVPDAVFSIHEARVLDADRQNGYLALEARPEQHLTIRAVDASGRPLPEADPADLPAPNPFAGYLPRERIVATYRYVAAGFSVSMSEEIFDRVAVPTAICEQLELESVLGQTGQFQHRARVNLKAVGVQALRVELPEDADLWATLVDDEPIEVHESAGGAFLVPLPTVGEVDALRTIELYYETQLEGRLDHLGRVHQVPPVLSVRSGSGSVQPVEVLQRQWTVHYPKNTLVVESTGRFLPTTPLDQASLLGAVQDELRVPTLHELWTNLVLVATAVVVLAVVTLIYRRWRWKALLVGVGMLLLLFAAFLSATLFLGGRMGPQSAMVHDAAKNVAKEDASGAASSQTAPTPGFGVAADPFASKSEFDDAMPEPAGAESEEGATRQPATRPVPTDGAAPAGGAVAAQSELPNATPQVALQEQQDQPAQGVDFVQPQQPLGQDAERPARRGEARLSVRVELTRPDSSSTQQFQYLGGLSGSDTPLQFRYENEEAVTIVRMSIAFGVLLFVFWLRRNASVIFKLMAGTVGLALPVALVTLLPPRTHLILDGVWLGSLGGVALWGLFALVHAVAGLCKRLPGRGRRLAGSLGLLSLSLCIVGSRAAAQEGRQQLPGLELTGEPTVVFPYEAAQDPLAADKVFVPRDLFLKLWNRAHPEDRIRRPAPVAAIVSGALYSARLESDAAGARVRVDGRLVLHSFRDEQVQVAVPLKNVALESAALDGAPAPLHWRSPQPPAAPQQDAPAQGPREQSEQAQQQALAPPRPLPRELTVAVTGAGRHVLDLVFYLPARMTGPEGEFTLPALPVAAGRLSLTLPAEDLRVQVNRASSQFRLRQDESSGATVMEVPVDQGGDISVSWRPREQSGSMNTIVHADSSTALVVTDRGTQTRMGFRLSVKQGALNSAAFRVPENVRLQRITGADVGGWEFSADGMRQLRVFFRREVSDSTDLTFTLYHDHTITERGGTVVLADFRPLGVTRDRGSVAVYAASQFEVRSIEAQGLRQINAEQFEPLWDLAVGELWSEEDEEDRSDGLRPRLAFRYAAPPLSLTLQMARRTAQALVTAEHAMRVAPRKTFMTARFVYELKGTPRARLAFRLPLDFLPLNVQAHGLADWYVREERFDELLFVEFDTPQTGTVEVVLEGFVRRLAGDEFVEIETTLPLNVDELQSTLAIGFDDLYSAALDEMVGWNAIELRQLSDAIRQVLPSPQFAFRTNELEPLPMSFSLDRNTPRLTADVVTVVTVFDTSVEYAINLKWQIRQAPADRFVFRGPDWLAGKLDLRAEGIRQVEETSTEDGQVRWIVTLREPIRNEFFALATATFPPPGTEPGAEAIRLPGLVFEKADSENGFEELLAQRAFVLLVNRSLNQLVAQNAEALQPVDGGELPIRVADELIDSAMVRAQLVDPESLPAWEVRRLAQTTSSPGSVTLADLVTVIAADGTWRTQAVYTTRNYRRQFLPVVLPPESRILSAFVNGRPARPVQTALEIDGSEMLVELVALPKASEADLAFPVKVVVSGRLDPERFSHGLARFGQQLRVPAPRVLSANESPEFGMPVLQTRWKVHLPEDWHVTLGETNLSEKPVHAEVLDELTRIQEARELLSVLERNASARQNYKAWNNALTIDKQLEQQTSSSLYTKRKAVQAGTATEYQELVRERDALRSKLDEYRARIQVDSANKLLTFESEGGAVERFDEAAQRQSVEQQNTALFELNSVGVSKDATGSLESFSFGLQTERPVTEKKTPDAPEEDRRAAGERLGKGQAGKAMFGRQSQLKSRAENQRESISQLRQQALQSETANGEPAVNAPQQPQPPVVRSGLRDFGQNGMGIGGGIGGGGFAGMLGQAAGAPAGGESLDAAPAGEMAEPWSTVGGLSLEFDIPADGQTLTLTKVSGDPQLTLQLRPQGSLKLGLGALWALVWLCAAVTLIVAARRGGPVAALGRLPAALSAIGLTAVFILPEPWNVAGYAVLLCGLVGLSIRSACRG